MYRNGVDVMNVEGTLLAEAIVNRATKGIAQDVVRLAWGDDTIFRSIWIWKYGRLDEINGKLVLHQDLQ